MTKRRVVVTGMGTVNPNGANIQQSWDSLLKGESGVSAIEHFDISKYSTQFAGIVKDFDPGHILAPKEARKMDRFIQLGMVAAAEAINDSGLDFEDQQLSVRTGVAVGSGIGGLGTIEDNHKILLEKGPRRVSPFLVPASVINMVAGNISIRWGLKGPNYSITTACTTGTHNIGYAARTIAYGDADVMIAGGAEAPITPEGLAAFSAARALSTKNDDPASASRPWDKDRDGFVLSEGAGILILEDYEHAKARGATIHAELTGFGMSGDAYHMTSPPEDGSGAGQAMSCALTDAGLNPDQVQYVNAHGTSTVAGDAAESQAAERVFGEHAKRLAISSTKSMTGHLVGAAGAVEAIFSILAIKHQTIPPTINLDNPDENCRLDYVPHSARSAKISAVLSNSFGFGGTNGSLIFQEV